MVSITFKAVYLFLALFALPQVLSAPAIVALDVRHNTPTRDQTVRQSTAQLNSLRIIRYGVMAFINWDTNLEREAWNHVSSCRVGVIDGKEMSILTDRENTEMRFAFENWDKSEKDRNLIKDASRAGCSTHHCAGDGDGAFHYFVCMYTIPPPEPT